MHVQYMHEGQNCRIVQRRNTPSTRKPVGSGVDEGSIELLQRCYRHSSMCHAKDGAKSSTVTNRQIFWRTLEPSSSKGGAVTDYLVDIRLISLSDRKRGEPFVLPSLFPEWKESSATKRLPLRHPGESAPKAKGPLAQVPLGCRCPVGFSGTCWIPAFAGMT